MRGDETSFFYAVLVKGGSSQYALAAIFILESTNYLKEFIDKINCMSGKYSRWAIFQDLITMMAISMANACDKRQAKEREDEYMSIIHRYNKSEQETFPEMLGIIVSALEQNPDQDFLGDIYMQLSLADKMKAQYFTPYHLSKAMAEMVWTEDKDDLPFINEPTCGSGANLIAIANLMREKKFNYQQNAYFVAQDIDPLVAKMCYIQLSLLGCPGVVIIGNTLEGRAGEREYWYTPFHFVFGIGILARKRRQEEAKKEIVIDKAEVAESDTDGLLRAVGII